MEVVVDDVIGPDTVVDAAAYGADVFMMGSAFFRSSDYKLSGLAP